MIGNLMRIGLLFTPLILLFYAIGCLMYDTPMSAAFLMFLSLVMLTIGVYFVRTDYFAGTIEVENFPDGTKRYSLNLESDPRDLDQKKRVTFYVEASRD